ncbi:hypothetical protein ACV3P7_12780 [Clostridium perfringens]
MDKFLENLSASKAFCVFSGLSSLISLVMTFILKDNVILWIILSTSLISLFLIIWVISYNSKLVGKLDSVNMHIIGESVELENDEEDDDIYINKESSIIVLSSNLSRDKINEQHRAMLEIRLPSYLRVSIDFTNGIRKEDSNSDFYKISVPLTKDITYVKIKSFIVEGIHYNEFITSSKRVDIKLSSTLLSNDKSDYISIEI